MTVDDWVDFAIGDLELSIDEFLNMTPRNYVRRFDGFIRAFKRQYEGFALLAQINSRGEITATEVMEHRFAKKKKKKEVTNEGFDFMKRLEKK